MNEIKIFESEQFGAIRTVVNNENGEVWFIGKDVAEALGYKNVSYALLTHVSEDDRMLLNYKAYRETREASKLWQGQDYSDKVILSKVQKSICSSKKKSHLSLSCLRPLFCHCLPWIMSQLLAMEVNDKTTTLWFDNEK